MEFQQLRHFIAVAEHGSFSNAAANLSVPQPKLSRCIRALEDELGTPLFFRTGRGVVLSEAGEYLFEQSAVIIQASRAIETGIQSITGNPGGTVRIGLPASVAALVALNIIDRIAETFPRVEIEIEEAGAAHVLEWLSAGRVDLAVLSEAPRASTLLTQPLADEDLCLVCPAGSGEGPGIPIGEEALRGRTILLTEGSLQAFAGTGCFADCDLRRLESIAASIDFVRQGRGFALLPASAAHAFARDGAVVIRQVAGQRLTRKLSLATSTRAPLSPATRKVADVVAEIIRRTVSCLPAEDEGARLVA
ncbi:LysR family transcriptional regulator [Salipiger sp.]|uniref:LysR family transcriptional regulator n=1 Tax=Salipiger sp. TaxID=2078585 RepID=UPI003A96BD00